MDHWKTVSSDGRRSANPRCALRLFRARPPWTRPAGRTIWHLQRMSSVDGARIARLKWDRVYLFRSGLVSGLFTRSLPLALMGSADQVLYCFAGNDARDIRRSVLIVAAEGYTTTSSVLLSRCFFRFQVLCGLQGSFLASTAHMIRAVLFAIATVARRAGFRCNRPARHGSAQSGLMATCRTRDIMPTKMSWRKYLSPIFVILPNRSLPPLE